MLHWLLPSIMASPAFDLVELKTGERVTGQIRAETPTQIELITPKGLQALDPVWSPRLEPMS